MAERGRAAVRVAESIGFEVLVVIWTAGLIGNGAAAFSGHRMGFTAFATIAFITLVAGISSTFRRGTFADSRGRRDYRRAVRTGEIPEGADTTGWIFELQEGESPWAAPLAIVLIVIAPVLAVIALIRAPGDLVVAIVSMVAEIGLLANVVPGFRERRARRERLLALLLDRVAEQDAASTS